MPPYPEVPDHVLGSCSGAGESPFCVYLGYMVGVVKQTIHESKNKQNFMSKKDCSIFE